jgi:hypothetical protein
MQKNNGATSANSTAAEPRRLRRKRPKMLLAGAVATAGDDIENFPGRQRYLPARTTCKNYLKVIVEWFRRIEAERAGPPRKR